MAPTSAIPDLLERYAGAAGDLDDELVRIGGDVQSALDAFAARASDVPVTIEPLGEDTRALASEASELDEWVGRVGSAFRRVGAGVDFLGWLFRLNGQAFDPVGAQPDWTDAEVAAALETILGLDPARPPGSIAQPLVSPDVVRRFVSSLTPAQLADLAAQHPELVGPVDGMPHELRYAANRTLIDRALAQARLDGDTALVATLEKLEGAERQFLFFDPAGDGRAAEVFGDLTTAEDVTVFVPGITNTLDNFSATRDNANHIYTEMELRDPDGSHATIAWLGYDTPGITDSPLPGRAHESAPLLRQLWDGLDLPSGVNTTLVGHSYGSLVSATALRDGFEGIDSFVVIGSPGLQAGDLEDLDLAEGTRFFAGRAPGDPVSLSESFGRDPSDPRFDGLRIATGDGVTGHSSYTNQGSESLRNLAYIGLGDYDSVTTLDPSTGERIVGAVDDLHSIVSEAPIDGIQWLDEGLDGIVHGGIDGVQDLIPLGPLDGPIDALQGIDQTVDQYLDSLVDVGQRLTSPDLYGDLIGDLFAMDVPGRVVDHLVDTGVDITTTVIDTGEDLIDSGVDLAAEGIERGEDLVDSGIDLAEDGLDLAEEGLDTLGDVAGDAREGAEDVAGSVWDNTGGRLPWP